MKYSLRAELYDSVDDVLNDVHQDDYRYEQYVGEALKNYSPFQILKGLEDELAIEICVEADDLILQEIEEVEEDKDEEED